MNVRLTPAARLTHTMVAVILISACRPGIAGIFSKSQPVPDWALQANKTHTPDYAKDAAAVILYDEYVETIDAQGRAVEREREAIRILKPQGRHNTCQVGYDVDEKINYFRVWTIAADEKQYMAQDNDFTEQGDTSVPSCSQQTGGASLIRPPLTSAPLSFVNQKRFSSPFYTKKCGVFRAGFPSFSRPSKWISHRDAPIPNRGIISKVCRR